MQVFFLLLIFKTHGPENYMAWIIILAVLESDSLVCVIQIFLTQKNNYGASNLNLCWVLVELIIILVGSEILRQNQQTIAWPRSKLSHLFKIQYGGQGYLSEWQNKDLDVETGRRDYKPSHLTKSHLLWYLPQMPLLEFSSYDYWEISACEKLVENMIHI